MNDKQQLAAMGERMAEQSAQNQPLCMAKRIEELQRGEGLTYGQLLAQCTQLREALQEARTGLAWYQETYPEAVNGSDDEAMARIDAALAGKLPAPAVPEGWQLVPVMPTPEMMLYKSECQHHSPYDLSCYMRRTREAIWRAMLAAAPKPEAK